MTRSIEELSLPDMVSDALAQQGVRAVVLEKDNGLEMSARDAKPIWVDAAADLQQWSLLPVNIRQRKANFLAMRLVHLHRGGDPNEKDKSGASIQLPSWLEPAVAKIKEWVANPRVKIGAAVVLAIGVLTTIIVVTVVKGKKPPPPPNPNSETEEQRSARLGRACEGVRVMMWKGGAWLSMPLEGWTVELWLSRQNGDPISAHPALTNVVSGGKVNWGDKSAFTTITDGKADIVPGKAAGSRSEVTVVFSEGYARPFFDIDRRHEFVSISEQLVKDTNADWGALYARCTHLTARDVGAWFYGRDPAKAATSLMYTMGKQVGSKGKEFVPFSKDFLGLSTSATKLDEPGFFSLVYENGARTANRDGIFVTFPFTSPVNAQQASKRVATELGI